MVFFEAITCGISPPILIEQRSVSHRFLSKENKKATDKVALISERYLAGGLSCLQIYCKSGITQPVISKQSDLEMELRSLFHLNHSVGTPIQFLKQNRCSKMIIHNQKEIASAILQILLRWCLRASPLAKDVLYVRFLGL